MKNIVQCEFCFAKLDVSHLKPGKDIKCGGCSNVIIVPDPDAQPKDKEAVQSDANKTSRVETPKIEAVPTQAAKKVDSKPKQEAFAAQRSKSDPSARKLSSGSMKSLRAADDARPSTPVRAHEHLPGKRTAPSPAIKGAQPVEQAHDPSADLRKKGAKVKLMFFIGIAAAILIAVTLILVIPSASPVKSPDKNTPNAKVSVAEQYKAKLKEIAYENNVKSIVDKVTEELNQDKRDRYPGTSKNLYSLSNWCENNGLTAESQQHLFEAFVLDPTFEDVKNPILKAYELKKKQASSASALSDLGDWALKAGFYDDAKDFYIQADGMDAKLTNPSAKLDKLGFKKVGKEWFSLEDYNMYINPDQQEKNKKYFRERYFDKFPEKCKSNDPKSLVYTELDSSPYFLCITTSPKYDEKLMLEDFAEKLDMLYAEFKSLYGGVFDFTQMEKETLPVFICEDMSAYHSLNKSLNNTLPAGAIGHFDLEKGYLMFPADLKNPYEVIFHEGTHQLINAITRKTLKVLRQDVLAFDNMFWFTEGIATYFESFKRDPKTGKIIRGATVMNRERSDLIIEMVKARQYATFNAFLSKKYIDFMREVTDPGRDANLRNNLGVIYYSEAWSVVYFLHNYNNGQYMEKFSQYFQKEINGKGGFASFQEIFGDIRTIEDQWAEYVQGLK